MEKPQSPLKRITSSALRALGLTTRDSAARLARKSHAQGYREARGIPGIEDEPASGGLLRYGYRKATGGAFDPSTSWDENVRVAREIYERNPVARQAEAIRVGYVWGDGVAPQAEDDELQDIIDEFWRDSDIDLQAPRWCGQLSRYGAQVLPAFTRRADGSVELAYHDPEQIEQVITHPDNASQRWAVVIRAASSESAWEAGRGVMVYRVARRQQRVVECEERFTGRRVGDVIECRQCRGLTRDTETACQHCQAPFTLHQVGRVVETVTRETADEKPFNTRGLYVTAEQATLEAWEHDMLEVYGLDAYSGTCFLAVKNADTNQGLGRSDLLPVADWLDVMDETLFSLALREQYAGYFSFDVTLQGADDIALMARQGDLLQRPPAHGQINLHNEKEAWSVFAPDLKQQPSIEVYRALFGHAWGGLGFPVSWYSQGDETNRATAQAQGDPTWRKLELQRGEFRAFIEQMLAFARDQAFIAGRYTPVDVETGQPLQRPTAEVTLNMPPMVTRDTTSASAAMSSVASALLTSLDAQLVTRAEAAAILANVAAQFDVELDLSREELGEEHEPLGGTGWDDRASLFEAFEVEG